MASNEVASFGELLHRFRLMAALTQAELAERARVSVSAVSALERGTRQAPYRETIHLLSDALGLGPADQAALVQAAIRPRSAAAPRAQNAVGEPSVHGLPATLSSFVGRERELDAVGRLFAEGCRLVTISGPGGAGKTRLMAEVARAAAHTFPDGAWCVDLAPLSRAELVPQAVAATLGLRESAERRYTQAIAAWLAPQRALLVFDNCEHLLDPSAELAAGLLRDCPHIAIVATSRERLGIRGEQVYQVPPLPVPPPDFPTIGVNAGSALMEFAAVRLFVERAQAVRREFALVPENAQAVVAICRHLDGLPLAIELAAARVQVLTPEEIAGRLQRRFPLLAAAPREAPSRHRTLRALIDWSYELLGDAERVVLRRLSVFAGGCSLEAAETICGDEQIAPLELLDLLAALVDKSLVNADTSAEAARYALLESIRAYAAERLEEAGETDATRDRHADFMLQFARAAARSLVGPAQMDWVQRLELEHHNLRAALTWPLARGDGETALRFCAALANFWYIRGYYGEGRDAIARALACGPETPSRARAAALHGAASLADIQHDYAEARRLIEQSVALWRTVGDVRGLASGLAELGMHARHQGDFAAARRACEEALQIYATNPNPWGERLALGVLGWVAEAEGDHAGAQQLLERSLMAAKAAGSSVDVALQLNNLGILALRRGALAAAEAYHRQALPLARSVGAREPLACSLEGLAGVAAARGQLLPAARLIGAAAALREAIGSPRIAQFEEEHRRLLPVVQAALGEAAFVTAVAEGRSLPLEQAIGLAQAAPVHAHDLAERGEGPARP